MASRPSSPAQACWPRPAPFGTRRSGALAASPAGATGLGLDPGARAALKSKLSDASMTHVADDRAWCRAGLTKLATFPDASLSPTARLNKAVVKYAFELGRDAAPFDYGDNTLS